jgi:hypothetical protein
MYVFVVVVCLLHCCCQKNQTNVCMSDSAKSINDLTRDDDDV